MTGLKLCSSLFLVLFGQAVLVCSETLEHPKLNPAPEGSNIVERSYIVEFQDGVDSSSAAAIKDSVKEYITFEYENIFDGFAVKNIPVDKITQVLNEALVTSASRELVYALSAIETQPNPPSYGLDRIDSRTGLDNSYKFEYAGAGVDIFIVDSGILANHTDYTSRFAGCVDYYGGGCYPGAHGTHVAGTAASTTFGIAKDAKIYDFKVCDDEFGCPLSSLLAAANEITFLKMDKPDRKMVTNWSLGGSYDPMFNKAMTRMVDVGVVVVVAAGNDNIDACLVSPASTNGVITVGATNKKDERADFSNFGSCVDIFAPGVDIVSTWYDGNFFTISGTSMASPHVAGVAATLLGAGLDPYSWIPYLATNDVVINPGYDSPNRLLFNGLNELPKDEGERACFSEVAEATVLGKGPVAMKHLSVGDQVLTATGYQAIYGQVHDDTQSITQFLQMFITSHDQPLEVTEDHLIYVAGKANPIKAGSIKVGDLLQSISINDSNNAGARVTKIEKVLRHAVYAPLTPSGSIVVNGILASCYVSLQEEASEYLHFHGGVPAFDKLLSQHDCQHIYMSVVRIACMGVSPQLCSIYNEKGTLSIVQYGLNLAKFADGIQSIWLKLMMLCAFISIFGPLYLLETLAGPVMSAFALVLGVTAVAAKIYHRFCKEDKSQVLKTKDE